MTLSVAIMAHPTRASMVVELVRALGRPVTVVWDEINDRHDTGARAMAAHDPACTHHLVLQDDIVPCRDLIASAERALASTPGDVPVSLYTGRVRPFRAEIDMAVTNASDADASWITMCGIYWGPAIIVPTPTIGPMLDWFWGDGTAVINYDRRVSAYYALSGIKCWYTRPSLVDHRQGHKSLAGHPGKARMAHHFVGADRSGLDVDWSGAVVDVPHSDRMDDARQHAAKIAARRNRRRAA